MMSSQTMMSHLPHFQFSALNNLQQPIVTISYNNLTRCNYEFPEVLDCYALWVINKGWQPLNFTAIKITTQKLETSTLTTERDDDATVMLYMDEV